METDVSYATFKLYADSSSSEGFARLFDFAGELSKYNSSATPAEADFKALLSDWHIVGGDLLKAMQNFEEILNQAKVSQNQELQTQARELSG